MSTRDDLAQACAELVAEDGLAALSLRRVAERVGIKAPSIYVHFDGKESLLAAARALAAETLGQHLKAQGRRGTARERLLATAIGYLAFAERHPALFALLFLELTSARQSLAEAPDAASPYRLVLARVAEVLGGEAAVPADVEALGFGIWSLVHGAAVLRQTHLRAFSGPIVDATRRNVDRLLDGWLSGAPAPYRPRARGRTR